MERWKRVLLGISISLLLCWLPMGCQSQRPTPTEPPFAQDDLAGAVVPVTGKVLPVRWAELSFGTPAKVAEVMVAEGEIVGAGQVLARLDAHELEAGVAQAEAAVAATKAQAVRLETKARPVDLRGAEVAVELAREGVAAARLAADVASANVGVAESAVSSAEVALKRLKAGPTQDELEVARQNVELAKAQRYAAQGERDAIGGQRHSPLYYPGSYEAAQGRVMMGETSVTIAELSHRILASGARAEDIAVGQAQVANAVAALEAAQAQALAAQQQVTICRRQAEQARAQLALLGAPAREEDLAVARAQVAQAEAALEAARAPLARTRLVAPFAGTVAEVNLRTGEYVMMGVPGVALGDLDDLRVETTDLDEIQVGRVAPGCKVSLTFDALPVVELQGTVQRIALKSGTGAGGTTYKAIITFDETDPRLRWGMTAFADIEAE